MKKASFIFLAAIGASALLFSCHKNDNNNNNTATANVSETQVLTDFTNKIALAEYADLQAKATTLNNAIIALNNDPTAANLSAARQAWHDTRTGWETCEGFLLGPVEANNYDPDMDTWPVDYLQLDSLLANASSFDVSYVHNLDQSLRGFHPLEFILWGKTGNATVDSITARQKQYMIALSQDMLENIDSLNNSWATTGGNFQQQVLMPGVGTNPAYTSKQDVLLAIVGAISDICKEVGEQQSGGKIYDPYTSQDSTQTESPFSHNSLVDFRNNIMGAQNVYLCTWNGQSGASLSNFVAARNLSLDNTIKQQFTAAINALNNVPGTFESAIYNARPQLMTAMKALNTLQATLDDQLTTFIKTNVKD